MKQMEEQCRIIEHSLKNLDSNTTQYAEEVNSLLINLKLQDENRNTIATPGKYNRGVHIKMLANGELANGLEIYRDI